MKYNPQEEESPFKSFRLTISDPILVEAVERVERETAMSQDEILKNSLLEFLEEKNQIKLE